MLLDLEDAVPPDLKDRARELVAQVAAERPCWVRVNRPLTDECKRDLAALAGVAKGLRLPKVEAASDVDWAAQRAPGVPLDCTIESARRLLAALEIASRPACVSLAYGGLDFAADLGIPGGEQETLFARSFLMYWSAPQRSYSCSTHHGARLSRRQAGVAAAASLDRSLLVSRQDAFVGAQSAAFELASVEVEHAAGLGFEIGISGKDPAAKGPGPEGIFIQPKPDRGTGDLRHQASPQDLVADVWNQKSGKRQAQLSGGHAGDRLDLNHQLWGGNRGPASAGTFVKAL